MTDFIKKIGYIATMGVLGLAGCAQGDGTLEDVDPASLPPIVTWDDHIAPLLDRYCATCHSEAATVGLVAGYDYGSYAGARCLYGGLEQTYFNQGSMPPGAAPRPDGRQDALLRRWQAQGFFESLDEAGQGVKPTVDCNAIRRRGNNG